MKHISLLVLASTGCYLELASSEPGPSEPGIIDVQPPAAIVRPNGTVRISVRLFESDGTTLLATQPTFRLVSEDETIASVAGLVIRGNELGTTAVEVTDGVHGSYQLPVVVADQLPNGPAMFRCTASPIVQVAGVPDVIEVFDSMGTRIDATGVRFQIDPAIATVSGTSIDTIGAGTAILGATGPDGMPLLGSCVVVVAKRAPGSSELCDAGSITYGCWVSKAPLWLSRPGASSNVRVTFLENGWANDCTRINTRTTQVTPDSITFGQSGIASTFSGTVVGVAPGRTEMRISHRGERCLDGALSVGVDLGGEWKIECDDGARGRVTLASTPRIAFTHGADPYWGASGAAFGVIAAKSTGSSEVCGSTQGPMSSCTGVATGNVGIVMPQSGGYGTCTSGLCRGASISACNNLSAGLLQGPDELISEMCTFRRGGGSLDCGVHACSEQYRTCDNTVPLSYCGGTDDCYYTVAQRRFDCPSCLDLTSCANAAAAYALSICP